MRKGSRCVSKKMAGRCQAMAPIRTSLPQRRAYLNALNKLAYFAAKQAEGVQKVSGFDPNLQGRFLRSVGTGVPIGRATSACAPDSIREPYVRHASEALP